MTKTGTMALALTMIANAGSAQVVPLKEAPPDPNIAKLAQNVAGMHESFKTMVILSGGKCAEPSVMDFHDLKLKRVHLFCADGYAYTMQANGDQTRTQLTRFDPNGPP